MALKDDFAKQLEAQASVWQAQIKEYQERLSQAGGQSRADYEKAIEVMQQNAEEANKLLRQVQQTNETAWKDMQDATQKAFGQLQKGWGDALGRFI